MKCLLAVLILLIPCLCYGEGTIEIKGDTYLTQPTQVHRFYLKFESKWNGLDESANYELILGGRSVVKGTEIENIPAWEVSEMLNALRDYYNLLEMNYIKKMEERGVPYTIENFKLYKRTYNKLNPFKRWTIEEVK